MAVLIAGGEFGRNRPIAHRKGQMREWENFEVGEGGGEES